MANRAGLKKITKTVRGKKGAVKRSYWVKAKDAAKGVGGFLNRHKGKIALAGAAAIGAGLAIHRYRSGRTPQGTSPHQNAGRAVGTAVHGMKNVQELTRAAAKQKRRMEADLRSVQSETRRVTAATRRLERNDFDGADNIMNREAHKNLRKRPTSKLN